MGKRPFLFIIVFCVFWLAGCEQATPEILPTVTAVLPQPTATATNPPTALPSPTMVLGETVVPTATNTPELTQTSIKNDPTPTRPTSLPTVSVQANVKYKLVQPSSDALLDAIRRVAEFENMQSIEEWERSYYWRVNDLVRADMDNFYPASFPDSETHLNDDTLISYYFGWLLGISSVHYRILEDGIVQYLNREKPELKTGQVIEESRFSIVPYSVGLNDDSLSQWIIELDSRIFQVRKYLLIGQGVDGEYEILSSILPTFGGRLYTEGLSEFIFDKDFTGDEHNEIIMDTTNYWSNAIERIIEVYVWDGKKLIALDPAIDGDYKTMEVDYLDGEDVDRIQVIKYYSGRFGCEGESLDVYRWPNQEVQHTISEYEPPTTAACNLSLARNPYTTIKPEKIEQYQLLEQAVAKLLADDSASPDLTAYAQSQLAMAYAEQQNFEKARSIIDRIDELSDRSNYAQFVSQNDVTSSLNDLCRNLVANGEQALGTDVGEYINMWATHGRGYDSNDPNTLLICDLAYLARAQIQDSVLHSSQTPRDLLTSKDIQFEFDHAINLDEDPELEWVGILEPMAPWLVIFDDVNGEWQAHYISSQYYRPIQNVTLAQKDLTQDGTLDLMMSVQAKNDSGYPTYTAFSTYLIENMEDGFSEVANQTVFEEPILQELDREFFWLNVTSTQTDETTSWKELDGFSNESEDIGDYIRTLTDDVLTQSDPALPTKITDLLAYLPTDDPEVQPYREHLTYLLGYYYELSGNVDQAVTSYLDLIQQAPSSPWSWLAWARLAPVEG